MGPRLAIRLFAGGERGSPLVPGLLLPAAVFTAATSFTAVAKILMNCNMARAISKVHERAAIKHLICKKK